MSGTLYVVATPIGNLEDITLRALRVLKEVDLIACEDTRHTRKLLAHYNIATPAVSYHEHNERERAEELAAKLKAGMNVALVSDAGTPLVSDPGFRLVREAVSRGIEVVPIPGPSALVAALAASGLPTNEFLFGGFLPARRAGRLARLKALAGVQTTLIFYEAPHRIKEALADARETLGDRPCVLARELTKIHEEFRRGSLAEVRDQIGEGDIKGEMVLLIGPPLADNQSRTVPQQVVREVEELMRTRGLDRKGALKQVARSLGISKSEAYRRMMAEQAGSDEET